MTCARVPSVPLSRVPAGGRVRVVSVEPSHRAELAREGVSPGVCLTVQARGPAGGPIVIVLGRARLALSTDVASCVGTVVDAEGVGR